MSSPQLFHLDKDLKLPKITLQRWADEHSARPGGKARWVRVRKLLDRRTRSYTADELELMLELGKIPYEGSKGIARDAHTRMRGCTERARIAIVNRVLVLIGRNNK